MFSKPPSPEPHPITGGPNVQNYKVTNLIMMHIMAIERVTLAHLDRPSSMTDTNLAIESGTVAGVDLGVGHSFFFRSLVLGVVDNSDTVWCK